MSLVTSQFQSCPEARYHNAAEWLHGLGDIPLDRIVMDPPPGTATESDMRERVEKDRRFVELVDGTLVEKPMGSYESMIASVISAALLRFVLPRKLGVVTGESAMVRIAAGRYRMPDAAFTSFSRFPDGKPNRDAVWEFSPDLVVEVLSEGNTKAEIDGKLREYFAAGTRLAWIVDPRLEMVEVYQSPGQLKMKLKDDDVLDGADILDGFTLPLNEIFHSYD